jgi:hypothetical protein
MRKILCLYTILFFCAPLWSLKASVKDTVEIREKAFVYNVNPYKASQDTVEVKVLYKVKAGDKVLLKKADSHQWCYVQLPDSAPGYIYIGKIKPSETETAFMKINQSLYKDTLCKTAVNKEYNRKIRVKILERKGTFSKVELPDSLAGWIPNNRLEAGYNVVLNTIIEKISDGFQAIRNFGKIHWTLSFLTFILFWLLIPLVPAFFIPKWLYKLLGPIRFVPNWLMYLLLMGINLLFYFYFFIFFVQLPPYCDHPMGLLIFFLAVYFVHVFISTLIKEDRCPKCHRIFAGRSQGSSNHNSWTDVFKVTTKYKSGGARIHYENEYNHTWTENHACRFCGHKWANNKSTKS